MPIVSYGPRAKMIPPGPGRVRKTPILIGLNNGPCIINRIRQNNTILSFMRSLGEHTRNSYFPFNLLPDRNRNSQE